MWLPRHIEQRERALRLQYTTGLTNEQLDELVARVEELLPEPWNKPRGRKKKLTLRDAVAIAVAYSRQNIIQEVLAERWNVSQELVSENITYLVPLIEEAIREFIPTAEEAAEAVTGRVCLLDGSLGPCWSWDGHRELWTRKHGTTGHNFQVITSLTGKVIYVSDPVPGSVHDSVAIKLTPVAEILNHSGGTIADKGYQGCGYATPRKKPKGGELSVGDKRENANLSRLRAPVERAIAHIKSWRILHTDYRRPLKTYETTFRATIGLFFFKASFQP
jgi:transposase